MQIQHSIAGMRSACRALTASRNSLAFVPTMGALHAGHIALVRAARDRCRAVAVSIFVNPTQFGPNEDLTKYPRTFDHDCALLRAENVDLLFAPTADEMYPPGATTFVEVAELSDRLDGASRPGHFRGVATIVSKLFHIVEPTVAFFGQKDAAQFAVIRRMVRDLNFPVEIVGIPTVREPDGLAMSSRNRYLSPADRQLALTLSRALNHAQQLALSGITDASTLHAETAEFLRSQPAIRIDYVAVVNPDTLLPLTDVSSGALIAVAAFVGGTRLIDNILLPPR
jgi:pantoate--beta-alanine ligase